MSIFKNRLAISIAVAHLSLAVQPPSFAGSAIWSSNPVNNEWTNAQNWMPNTVPNGIADTANFATSRMTELTVTGLIEVASLNFESGADAYTISTRPAATLGTVLFVTGSGIINDSGQVQRFQTEFNGTFTSGVFFEDDATAGEMISFVGVGGQYVFLDSSSAGSASFDISATAMFPGEVAFSDNSTAADATITLSSNGGATFFDTATAANAVIMATSGGDVTFGTASTAGNAIINLSGDSEASFTASSTADHCQITAQGAVSSSEPGVELSVGDNATAGEATFVLEGGQCHWSRRDSDDLLQ